MKAKNIIPLKFSTCLILIIFILSASCNQHRLTGVYVHYKPGGGFSQFTFYQDSFEYLSCSKRIIKGKYELGYRYNEFYLTENLYLNNALDIEVIELTDSLYSDSVEININLNLNHYFFGAWIYFLGRDTFFTTLKPIIRLHKNKLNKGDYSFIMAFRAVGFPTKSYKIINKNLSKMLVDVNFPTSNNEDPVFIDQLVRTKRNAMFVKFSNYLNDSLGRLNKNIVKYRRIKN